MRPTFAPEPLFQDLLFWVPPPGEGSTGGRQPAAPTVWLALASPLFLGFDFCCHGNGLTNVPLTGRSSWRGWDGDGEMQVGRGGRVPVWSAQWGGRRADLHHLEDPPPPPARGCSLARARVAVMRGPGALRPVPEPVTERTASFCPRGWFPWQRVASVVAATEIAFCGLRPLSRTPSPRGPIPSFLGCPRACVSNCKSRGGPACSHIPAPCVPLPPPQSRPLPASTGLYPSDSAGRTPSPVSPRSLPFQQKPPGPSLTPLTREGDGEWGRERPGWQGLAQGGARLSEGSGGLWRKPLGSLSPRRVSGVFGAADGCLPHVQDRVAAPAFQGGPARPRHMGRVGGCVLLSSEAGGGLGEPALSV